MWELLSPLQKFISFDKHRIDNAVFRLHSKTTVLFLVCSSLLVTAQTFLGDPIHCVVHGVIPAVMDTYCWIHSTFTLPSKHYDPAVSDLNGATAHPGIGNPYEGEPVTEHKYYQWVWFTLLFQALLFYLPSGIWQSWEGKRLQRLIPDVLVYSPTDARMPLFPKPVALVGEKAVNDTIGQMKDYFSRYYGTKAHKIYFWRFTFCEFLTLVNVVGQIFFTDHFLGGMFTTYGTNVLEVSSMDPEERYDPMNLVFPKVTKCTFKKFGSSGTVQTFDGLCVLPVNIINEKVYIFLWFWFVLLAIVTGLHFIYRLVTVASRAARKAVLLGRSNLLVDGPTVDDINDNIGIGEWYFLCQVGANLDPYVFAQFLKEVKKIIMTKQKANGGQQLNGKIEKIA